MPCYWRSKTIDNDLAETDHCPGYSAARYVATSTMEVILMPAFMNTPMVCILEVMGRGAGLPQQQLFQHIRVLVPIDISSGACI